MMLPKISEEKNLKDERIQDFCASMKIENYSESKKKLDVRSIYATENESRQSKEVKPGKNRSVSANISKSSSNSSRDRLGFSRSHLFSAKTSKRTKYKTPKELEETIDLTSIDDAKKLTRRYYQELGICSDGRWSKDIESHLLKFEDADLSFPNLRNKEELFERANKYAIEKQSLLRQKSTFEEDTTLKHTSRPRGKENSARVKTKTHPKLGIQQMTNGFDEIFYSKPVCWGSISNQKSYLISSHFSQRTNRLPSLNTRAVPPKYGSTSWLNSGRTGYTNMH
ncbi:uncharacterized protein LOC116288245 [Actinia tenebrosa]|uniref:Uncharacterized protein LOC116288245 n=1 Tax=Actinia tenebrosa TaxID=6105 RepID=A0A6P8H3D8_ACTTE|nr:uncharacterized protein LOC116288245 [Actinia tenebrosa]